VLESRETLLENTFSVSSRVFNGNNLKKLESTHNTSKSPVSVKKMEKEAIKYINTHREISPILPQVKKKLTVHESHVANPVKRSNRNKNLVFKSN